MQCGFLVWEYRICWMESDIFSGSIHFLCHFLTCRKPVCFVALSSILYPFKATFISLTSQLFFTIIILYIIKIFHIFQKEMRFTMKKNTQQTRILSKSEWLKPHGSKRAVALACAGLLALSFTGCGKKQEQNAEPSPTGATAFPDEVTNPPASPTPEDSEPTPTTAPTPTLEPTAVPTMPPAIYGDPAAIAVYDTAQSNYTLNIDASFPVHEISDLLYGIFIEDINFAADGGLYAELVQNRSFEFTNLAAGNEKHAWKDVNDITAAVIKDDADGCLNANNPNYMVLENNSDINAGIENSGFLDGMAVKEGDEYIFSIYARGLNGYTGAIYVNLMFGNESIARETIDSVTAEWKKYELTLKPSSTVSRNLSLSVTIDTGSVAIDMVSLFPKNTYKGRENGLREDLAEKLEALSPAFLRFPGGCVVEGATLATAYDWKDSIGVGPDGEPLLFNGTYGDVAARKQGQNIWTDERATNDKYPSYMSYGLGFYEYFLLAEDIGAIGVPVVNCGLGCMGQGSGLGPDVGSEEFEEYVQDALDLVEFCRGDASTKWGAVRIAMGHEAPFALKYIGIGNEQWGNNFFRHYEAFVDAFDKAKTENPALFDGIELMFSAGVDDGDSGVDYMASYEEAARWLAEHPDRTIEDFAGATDHHYYNSPSWFYNHVDYYDEKNYSRDTEHMTETKFGGGINVFLGEYAAQSNTLNAALSEAAYMTGLERNGDIVKMAAYAPLFGNLTALHWAPDLIWFNNVTSTCSVNYYVQQVFAKNAGSALLSSTLTGADIEDIKLFGRVGVGTWNTSATYDNIKVTDNTTGAVLAEDDFSDSNFSSRWITPSDGNWSVKDGALLQASSSTNTGRFGNIGSAAYFGETSLTNYTYELTATKNGGQEGFLIPFAVRGVDDNFFWNIGGWNNTLSCLQQVEDSAKSGQLNGTVKDCRIEVGKTYALKIVVNDTNVKCYIDNELYVDYDLPETTNAESYQVVSTDENGDIIIKLVNVTGLPKTFAIDINGVEGIKNTASLDLVAGTSLENDNVLGKTEVVTLQSMELEGAGSQFNYTAPMYSVSVLRLKKEP